MAQLKVRNKYWKVLNNNKWFPRFGTETEAAALARYNANANIATSTVPSGIIKDGGLDVCNENEIRGWVISPLSDVDSAFADIYIGGFKVASVLANQPRTDVNDYYGFTTGFSAFGFTYPVPPEYKNPGVSVNVKLRDRTEDVENSPRVMVAVATTTFTTTVPLTTTSTTSTTTIPVSTTSTTFNGLAKPSAIAKANSSVLTVVAENNGSKWRVRKTTTTNVPSGFHEVWYINGNQVSGLSTAYEYESGDEIVIMYAITSGESPDNWTQKGWAKVVFGTIVTN